MREERSAGRQWLTIMLYVIIFLVLLIGGGYVLLPLGGGGVLLWMLLAAAGLFFLIRWHAGRFVYSCRNCGRPVKTSLFKDVFCSEGTSGELCLRCRKKTP